MKYQFVWVVAIVTGSAIAVQAQRVTAPSNASGHSHMVDVGGHAPLVLPWSGEVSAREDFAYHRTVERVLKLLPRQPTRVVIVDTNQADGDVRNALQRIDAFITKVGRVVYLTSHSEILQAALKGWSLHEHILATIIWHEMAHIDGADEVEAQRREEALLTSYIIAERVDRVEAMRYLATLKGRRGRDGKLTQGNVEETVKARALEHPIAVIECIKPSCDP